MTAALAGAGRGLPAAAHEVPAAVVHANRVVACSAAARAEGVQRGLRRREAQARCPGLVVFERDLDAEARAFEPVMAALDALCPRIEVLRPGQCAFATRGPSRYFGGDEALAALVVETVPVPCRVGIADGVFAARLAARTPAPEADAGPSAPARPAARTPASKAGDDAAPPPAAGPWRVVPAGASRAFVAPFPVSALERPELADLLVRLGLRTLGQLADLPPASVLARFGPEGELAHRLARGLDERPLAARVPPPDFSVSAELDPPADRVDRAAFVARSLAASLHDELAGRGLACTRVLIEAETEHGEQLARLWRHDGALTAAAVAERVRWQLDGWLTARPPAAPAGGDDVWAGSVPHTGLTLPKPGAAPDHPTAGITLVRLTPDEVRPDTGRQLGFWGGATLNDERAARALARVQGMLGPEGVGTAVIQGGRSPAERVRFVTWGDAREPDRPELEATASPWPGHVPPPAPAAVHPDPVPAEVVDGDGRPVSVTGRGLCSGEPARASVDGGPWAAVEGWAGPWPVDERWWDPPARRRRARFQLLLAGGAAHLAAVEGGRWWVEATYD